MTTEKAIVVAAAAATTIGPFLLNNDLQYAVDAIAQVPTMQPGEFHQQKFVVVFRHIPPEERTERLRNAGDAARHALALQERQDAGETLTDEEVALIRSTPSIDLAMLSDALVRIESGVVDSAGRDISQEASTRDALLRNQWARQAIWNAYTRSLKERDSLGN